MTDDELIEYLDIENEPKALRAIGLLCPRCLTRRIDPVLIGSKEEGHICGNCWLEDRRRDTPEDLPL